MRKRLIIVIFFISSAMVYSAFAQYSSSSLGSTAGQNLKPTGGGLGNAVAVTQKLGETLPADMKFTDSEGNTKTFAEFIDKPTILALVYYDCPGLCTPIMNNLSRVLQKIDVVPSAEYRAVSISFDPSEKPALAREKKSKITAGMKHLASDSSFPKDGWLFLTGNEKNIARLTEATGFEYQKIDNGYVHPGTLIVLSPERKIIRYIFGKNYLKWDLQMAVNEASEGRVGSTITKMLLTCFNYDPESKSYVVNFTRIAGIMILAVVITFFMTLVLIKKKNK